MGGGALLPDSLRSSFLTASGVASSAAESFGRPARCVAWGALPGALGGTDRPVTRLLPPPDRPAPDPAAGGGERGGRLRHRLLRRGGHEGHQGAPGAPPAFGGWRGWGLLAPTQPPSCPQLLDSDQELYRNFPLVLSERWQKEVAETVYEAVNADTDKAEARKRAKSKQLGHEEGGLCGGAVGGGPAAVPGHRLGLCAAAGFREGLGAQEAPRPVTRWRTEGAAGGGGSLPSPAWGCSQGQSLGRPGC